MQIANPMIAAGVADHSGFDRDPWERLWGTLEAVLTVTFGDVGRARAAADRVTSLHEAVVGERGGAPYSALDPALMLWVHATLVDSALVTYERFVGPLSRPTKELYYQEMKTFALAFRTPLDVLPVDLAAFERYLAATLPKLRVSDEAQALAPQVLDPPVPRSLVPLRAAQRIITIGMLPAELRAGFGFDWSASRELGFRAAASAVRATLPLLPDRVRRWPHALEVDRRLAQGEQAGRPRRFSLRNR